MFKEKKEILSVWSMMSWKGEVENEVGETGRGHVMQAWPLSTQRRRLEFIFKLTGKVEFKLENTALCRGKNGSRETSEGFAGLQV